MTTERASPTNLIQAIQHFSDLDVATVFVAKLRWPHGPTCPDCGGKDHSYISTRRLWKCKNKTCKRQFSVKVGTIFEDSPIPLNKWLAAIWEIANDKNGISSHELAAKIGVTQKTAWFMNHRIRLAMQTGSFEKWSQKFDGAVEVDETYIGGKARMMNAARQKRWEAEGGGSGPFGGKTGVLGFRERGGDVAFTVIDDRESGNLQRHVRKRVKPSAMVITDELSSYKGLDQHYQHEVINHAERYADGQIHSNGLENFWSVLKRSLGGTYVSVRPFHLFRYLDEQAYRYNRRGLSGLERVDGVVGNIGGRRVTWKQLTGKQEKKQDSPKSPPRKPRAFPMGPF